LSWARYRLWPDANQRFPPLSHAGATADAARAAAASGAGQRPLVRRHGLGPLPPSVVEAGLEGRLHDPEVGRQVEVPRRVKRVMADVEDLAPLGAGVAVGAE